MSMSRPSPSLEVSQGACGVMPSTSGIGSSCPPPSCAKSPASYGRIFWEERRLRRRLKLLVRMGEIVTPRARCTSSSMTQTIIASSNAQVEGQAHLIVSGDRDLRRLKIYQGIPIVTPTDFLRTLGG